MHVVIFSGGNVEQGKATRVALGQSDMILAADHGAEAALSFGYTPQHVLGDFDSLAVSTQELLKKEHVQLHTFKHDKDETDTELAVLFAKEHGATSIDILGGVEGNRIDHVLANIFLAQDPIIRFINGDQITWIRKGPVEEQISGRAGDLLSLLPLSETVEGITTTNLKYHLENSTLAFGTPRGISNVFTEEHVLVSFAKGTMLFVHTLLTEA